MIEQLKIKLKSRNADTKKPISYAIELELKADVLMKFIEHNIGFLNFGFCEESENGN